MKQINTVIGFWELLLSLSFPWSTLLSMPSPNKSLSLSPPGGFRIMPGEPDFSRRSVGDAPGPPSNQLPEAQTLSGISLNWPLSLAAAPFL